MELQRPEDGLHLCPIRPELLRLLSPPIVEYFLRILWRFVELSPSEVEKVRRGDDGHLNDPQFVVTANHLGHGTALDGG